MNDKSPSWWNSVLALPESTETAEYRRLWRVWTDRTRFHGPKESPTRYHKLTSTQHETRLTCATFENFALFPANWVREFAEIADLAGFPRGVVACNWSYEWERHLDDGEKQLLDVVIEFEDVDGERGVIVVESKVVGAKPGAKDVNPEYYLGILEIAEFGPQRAWLVLYVGPTTAENLRTSGELDRRFGVISWDELADIQVASAASLPVPAPISRFVASAIHQQFRSFGVEPSVAPVEFLPDELTFEQLDAAPKPVQSIGDRREALWRL